jgi:protochlorophyllide reductase
VISVAAHPGLTDTKLLANSLAQRGGRPLALLGDAVNQVITQPVRVGVLPQLYAATAEQVRGGDYIGPGRFGETRGHPAPARRSPAAQDVDLARRLWTATADATGVTPDPQ